MAIMPVYRPTNYGGTGFGGGEQTLYDTNWDTQRIQNQGALDQLKKKQEGDLALQNNQARIQQQRLQSLLPLFGQGSMSSTVGGMNTPKPEITVGGVYSDDLVQRMVNSARAQGDQGAATQNRSNMNQMAGRGLSTNSPLAMALANQVNAANMATNAGNETNIRTNAAEANAKQRLNSETARSTQWQQDNALDIERRRQIQQQNQAFLSLIAQLAG